MIIKHYFRIVIIASIAVYLALTLVPTAHLGPDIKNILILVGGIILVNLIIHPIFSIVLLPINILTLGSLSFILNVILIYAFTKFLPGFSISAYNFPGANIQGFIIPPFPMNRLETIAAFGIIITFIQKLLHFIFE